MKALMHPSVYMCYLAAYKENWNFKNLARLWNIENKRYSDTIQFQCIKEEMRKFRSAHWDDIKAKGWDNLNVQFYMRFINDHLYFSNK